MANDVASEDSVLVPTDDGSTPRAGLDDDRWWRRAARASVGLTFFVYVAVAAFTATAPRTPWDEIGVLQMARLISGDGNVTPMSGSGYYPGWSFVLAPLWWLSHDPATVYHLAIGLVIIFAMLTLWPLTLIGMHLGLSRHQAVVVACIVSILPARSVHADYVLSETFLMFCIAWVVVAVLAYCRRPTALGAVWISVASTAALLTHSRALAVVATAAIWFVLVAFRRWRHAVLGLVTLAAGYALVKLAVDLTTQKVLLTGFGKEEIFSDAVKATNVSLLLKLALSQTFAQLVGTFGVFAVGVVLLLRRVGPELRSWQPGPWTFLTGLTGATMITSFLWWASPAYLEVKDNARFDAWVYTRYIDPVATIVVLVAIAALLQNLKRSTIVIAIVASLALCIPTIFWVAPVVPTYGSRLGPGNAAAILEWAWFFHTGTPYARPLTPTLTNAAQFWWFGTFTVMIGAAFGLYLRGRAKSAAVWLLVAAFLAAMAANPSQRREPPQAIRAAIEHAEKVTPGDGLLDVDIDITCAQADPWVNAQVLNWSGYWLSPRHVRIIGSSGARSITTPVVIACKTWRPAASVGAREYLGSEYGRDNNLYALWVMPGALQDTLAREDHLAPVPAG